MALGRLVTLNRKSTQTILLFSIFFSVFMCKTFYFPLNKMLFLHFTPEIFWFSPLLFSVHTSVSRSTVSSSLGINKVSEGDMSGLHGETFSSFKIQSVLLCKCNIWSMYLKLYLICLHPQHETVNCYSCYSVFLYLPCTTSILLRPRWEQRGGLKFFMHLSSYTDLYPIFVMHGQAVPLYHFTESSPSPSSLS